MCILYLCLGMMITLILKYVINNIPTLIKVLSILLWPITAVFLLCRVFYVSIIKELFS